jgi:hypothetical protein
MATLPVNEDRFLELLNKVLREQPDYQEGMAFVAAPEGSEGQLMRGYDTSSPYTSNGAYPAAVRIVRELYEYVPGASS